MPADSAMASKRRPGCDRMARRKCPERAIFASRLPQPFAHIQQLGKFRLGFAPALPSFAQAGRHGNGLAIAHNSTSSPGIGTS